MSKSMVFTGLIENVDDNKNSTFKEVSIRVHGLGKNNNGSNITESAYENAKNSILGIPIVAKYTEEVDVYGESGDLTEHNTICAKDKDGNYYTKYDTVPLGFVNFDANITTEDIEEDDGRVRTYIKVDKVILWKRYEATEKIMEWLENGIVPKVSMEIGNVGGKVQDGYFQIDNFEYRAICALGSDVTPCFDKAEILEFEKRDFNTLYQEMMSEYSKEGGEEMAEKIEETVIEPTEETTVETEVEKIEQVEETEAKEVSEEVVDNATEETNSDFEVLRKEFESLKSTVEELKAVNKELSEYKALKEKEELKQEVDTKVSEFELSDEEVSEIREQAYSGEITVAEFEKELFALVGKKALEQRKEFTAEKVDSGVKMKVTDNTVGKQKKSVYGEYDKYFNKNN